MSDGTDTTAAAIAELKQQIVDLRRAVVEGREADTAAEQKAADAKIEDAEDDIAATAKKLGLSPKQYQSAIAEAKRAQFKADHKDAIKEILAEIAAESKTDDEDDDDDDEGDEGAKGKGKATAKDADKGADKDSAKGAPKKDADTAPVVEHWSNRPAARLLGLGGGS